MAKNIFQSQKEIDEFTEKWESVTNMIKEHAKIKVEVEVPSTEEIIGEKIQSISNLIESQKQHCKDQYNIGIYNGLVLAKSVLTGEIPKYYEMEENKNE